MNSFVKLISLMQLMLMPYYSLAATSTNVKITSYVTEPVCTLDAPSEVDLGENWTTTGGYITRPSFTIKINCENNLNVPTWLTAYAENPNGSATGTIFTLIRDSNGNMMEQLMFVLENGKYVNFSGFDDAAFCQGSTARECKITPMTITASGLTGEGEGKVWIWLNYN
ncbi:hypothetical protein DDL85_003479 [Escherichia coli]|nr:hypothetical protein [Escherichia coli]